MKQIIIQLYPAISIIVMLLVTMKFSPGHRRNLNRGKGNQHQDLTSKE